MRPHSRAWWNPWRSRTRSCCARERARRWSRRRSGHGRREPRAAAAAGPAGPGGRARVRHADGASDHGVDALLPLRRSGGRGRAGGRAGVEGLARSALPAGGAGVMGRVLRSAGAVVAGLAVTFVLIAAVELFSVAVHPFPEGFGGSREEIARHV